MIRRVRELGGSISAMLTVFELQIRVLTEMACPAWNGALTGDNVHELESIQKAAVAIILNYNFKSYKKALQKLQISSLEFRRKELCLKFAKKTSETSKFDGWFRRSRETRMNRKYTLPKTRTATYEKSPLIYLTKLLNSG